MAKQTIMIPVVLHTTIFSYFAHAAMNSGANSYEDISKGINLLLGTIGEEGVKKILRDDYIRIMEGFYKFQKDATFIEAYLNGLTLRDVSTKELTSPMFLRYKMALFRAKIYTPEAGELLKRIIEYTNLARVDIPPRIFTQLKTDRKRMDREQDYKEGEQEDYEK